MFNEVGITRGLASQEPLKCYVHASLLALADNPDEINHLVEETYFALAGEPNVDGAVVHSKCGPILVRDHDNGGISFYAAILPNHQPRFTESTALAKFDIEMLGHGFIPCPPAIDTGIDCIYYREVDNEVRIIQLKQRVGIWRKYLDRNIWMAFPDDQRWFVYPHDGLVDLCKAEDKWVHTPSWTDEGHYHSKNVPKWMEPWMTQWKLGL